MKLYLVRHGETKLNKEFRFIGRTDEKLSKNGLLQAKEAASRLGCENIKAIYSSDLKRAMQTARVISKYHGLSIKRTKRLREIDFGEWESLTYDEIDKLHHDIFKEWLEDPISTRIPGGEPWDKFKERILGAIRKIITRENGGNVVIVLHGGPIKLLMSYFNADDPSYFKNFWPSPGSINIVEISEEENATTSSKAK